MDQNSISRYVGVTRSYDSVAHAITQETDCLAGVVDVISVGNTVVNVFIRCDTSNPCLITEKSGASVDCIDLYFDARSLTWEDLDKLVIAKEDDPRSGLSALISIYSSKEFGEELSFDIRDLRKLLQSYSEYCSLVRYRDNLIGTEDVKILEQQIGKKSLFYIHNASCSGKTYCALSLSKSFDTTIVYRPNWITSSLLDSIFCLMSVLQNSCFLFDDLQCSPSEGYKIVRRCFDLRAKILTNSSCAIAVSWETFYQNLERHDARSLKGFFDLATNLRLLNRSLRIRLRDVQVDGIGASNPAMLDAIHLAHLDGNHSANSSMKESIVRILLGKPLRDFGDQELLLIYLLATLGSYEFLPTRAELKQFGISDLDSTLGSIPIVRSFDNGRYYLAHRSICEFIVNEARSTCSEKLTISVSAIVTDYISSLQPEDRWKSLSQIISDSSEHRSGRFLPIWKVVSSPSHS